LRANLDEAFTRRLQFAVDFPFPDEADRLRIWRALFPPALPHDPDLNLAFLAQRFKLSGGSIRNILISTAYLAAADGGQVTMEHLLHGTRREMQKMGKIVEGLEARVKD
jgi:SpoVK/Ycf46/Vps4 family AAA+-type ATPase